MESEEQGQVAVDAFFFEFLGSANAFPCRCDLDENAIARNARALVKRVMSRATFFVASVS